MKLLICSDIHGDYESALAIIEASKKHNAEKIIILGDILYHGPRNDLPKTYAPKRVIELLNANKEKLLCVRGNCDTEVDQMVLEFPVLSDYAVIFTDGLAMYLTHGHKFGMDNPPPLQKGDILLCGHTHICTRVDFGDANTYLNPGSVAIPKAGTPRSYMIYEDKLFTLYDLQGKAFESYKF